ncbi:MAG: hypothetical protein A2138_20585 [Deltaproteobacteria bacterium RBG_16_71_12]|nr:MAG: hypothetical protein A2138_20585 [Deltaproteobacteria bacterium RBG_16_71_12]
MTQPPRAPAEPGDVLEEQPTLSRSSSVRALDEIVAQERVRQDGRFAALRRLRDDTERALAAPAPAAPSWPRRLAGLLARPRRRRASTEHELRRRYQDAQLRARRAVSFTETLAELSRELGSELERLRALLADLASDDRTLDSLIGRLRAAAGDAEARRAVARDDDERRRCEDRAERVSRRAQEQDALRDAVRAAEDRLLRLVESERMSLARVDALRAEVARAARTASQRLDDLGATLRARATTDDAERVLAELEEALAALFGALDDDARASGGGERAP